MRSRTLARAVALAAAVAVPLVATPAQAFVIIGPTQVPDALLTQDLNVQDPTLNLNLAAPRHVRLISPIDGVITSWRTYSAQMGAGATLQLRVLMDEGAGSFRVLRSGPVEPAPGILNGKATEQSFDARIPIPAGAQIGVQRAKDASSGNLLTIVHDQPDPSPWLGGWYQPTGTPPPADGAAATVQPVDGSSGSSDPFFPISAVVEPDADDDAFGDETQDRCPSAAGDNSGCPGGAAFEVPAAPAQGATILGPSFDLDPNTVIVGNRPSPSLAMNTVTAPGTQLRSRFRGVVTRWSFYTGDVSAGSSAQLRLLRRVGDDDYQAVASGPVEALSPDTGPATLRTFAGRVPVGAGDELGVMLRRETGGNLGLTAVETELAQPSWFWSHFAGTAGNSRIPNDGENAYPVGQSFGSLANTFLPISAVVERDGDGDLFGDHTQDRCLNSPGPVDGCPAPAEEEETPSPAPPPPGPPPPGPGPGAPQPIIQVDTVVPLSANAIIDADSVRFTTGRRRLSVSVSCPVQQASRCTGRLIAKTANKVRTARRKRKVLGLGGTSFTIAQGSTKTLTLRVPSATREAIKALRRVSLALTIRATTRTAKTIG